jgi:hypothetical protein
LEEVTVSAGHKVLMEVDYNILLIVADPQGILDLQIRPHPIPLLNIFVIFIDYIIHIIRLKTEERPV